MPINLFFIPQHIRDSVIQKFCLADFLNFHKSSRKSFDAAKKVKTKFTIERYYEACEFQRPLKKLPYVLFEYENQAMETFVDHVDWKGRLPMNFCEFPLRLEGFSRHFRSTLTEEFCSALIHFFTSTYSTINSLYLEGISCSPTTLSQLVEISKIKEIIIYALPSPDLLRIENIKNISNLRIEDFVSEETFLSLDAPTIRILESNITSAGINQLLQKLVTGERRIDDYEIYTNRTIHAKYFLKEIPVLKRVYFESIISSAIGSNAVYHLCYGRRSITIHRQTLEYNIQKNFPRKSLNIFQSLSL